MHITQRMFEGEDPNRPGYSFGEGSLEAVVNQCNQEVLHFHEDFTDFDRSG